MVATRTRGNLLRQPTPHPRKQTFTYQCRRYSWMIAGTVVFALWGSWNNSSNITSSGNVARTANNSNSNGSASSSNSRTGTAIRRSLLQAASQSYQSNQVDGVEYYWQMPASSAESTNEVPSDVKGILFLAHPCNGSGRDWWSRLEPYEGSGTQEGDTKSALVVPPLPEHGAIVDMALNELHMAVVSVSASEVKSKCWFGRDAARVVTVLNHLQTTLSPSNSQEGDSKVPVYAFGVGSGGAFVSTTLSIAMAQNKTPLNGYISQVSAPKKITPMARKAAADVPRPPGVFISMPRDMATRSSIQAWMAQQGKVDGDPPLKHIQLKDQPLSETYFNERIPNLISPTLSRQLYQALSSTSPQKQQGRRAASSVKLLDGKGQKLTMNPQKSVKEWNAMLEPVFVGASKTNPKYKMFLNENHGMDRIGQILNVAWGESEVTRDGVLPAMEWLMTLQQQQANTNDQSKDSRKSSLRKK